MKKKISLFLVFVLMLSFVACNVPKEESTVQIKINGTAISFFETEGEEESSSNSIDEFEKIISDDIIYIDKDDKFEISFDGKIPTDVKVIKYYALSEIFEENFRKHFEEETVTVTDGKAESLLWSNQATFVVGLYSSPGIMYIGTKVICTFDNEVKEYYFMVKHKVDP